MATSKRSYFPNQKKEDHPFEEDIQNEDDIENLFSPADDIESLRGRSYKTDRDDEEGIAEDNQKLSWIIENSLGIEFCK